MDRDFYLQRALARLGDGRRSYDYQQRTPSNLKLLEEYLRRLRLWMDRLTLPFELWWQESDLAAVLDSQIRVSHEVYQWAFQLIEPRHYPYGVDPMTFENALRWETLKRQQPELIKAHALPDPYEPFILLLKRGGGFFVDEDDILHLTAGDLNILSREIHWLTRDIQALSSPGTHIVSLDEDVLDALDASPKLYGFLQDHRSNYCGQASNGDQYLFYSIHKVSGILILKFSASGELIESIEKEYLPDLYNNDFAAFTAEMGIHEMQVTVQKFFLPQYGFGIIDLPHHYEEFLADRSTFDKDEHEQYEEWIESWLISNHFVLELGFNDYWLDIEGHVIAT